MGKPPIEKTRTTIHELVVQGAQKGLELQHDDGSFPAGQNYTYSETETPVRTTSLWIRVMAAAYEITEKEIFRQSGEQAIDFLLNGQLRPSGYTYYCRTVSGKDRCNGLVGQSHVLHALYKAGNAFSRQDALEEAIDLFLTHPFDANLCLWERIKIDGDNLSFDRTLNHQILFANAASRLHNESERAHKCVDRFLSGLYTNMEVRPNGLIRHFVHPPIKDSLKATVRKPRHWPLIQNEIMFRYYSQSDQRKRKERGYQTVNVVTLGKLKERFPNHPFWDSDAITSAVNFVASNRDELVKRKELEHGNLFQGIGVAQSLSSFTDSDISAYSDRITSEICIDAQTGELSIPEGELDNGTLPVLVKTLAEMPDFEVAVNVI